MEELELLRELDKRTLQVQRAAEELCQAAAGLAVKFEGESGYWVPAEEFHELQRALKVVHDYALAVAQSNGAWCCGAKYVEVKTGVPTTCQRDRGHDSGPNATAHARRAIVGDVEAGWGRFGAEPKGGADK